METETPREQEQYEMRGRQQKDQDQDEIDEQYRNPDDLQDLNKPDNKKQILVGIILTLTP